MNCHIDHDVFELGEKYFRCDCGNRGSSTLCVLDPAKAHSNPLNIYGQNHDGLFCWCSSPYNASEDTMFQVFFLFFKLALNGWAALSLDIIIAH
jgi:hypothetical protein